MVRYAILFVSTVAVACEQQVPRPREAPEIKAPETILLADTIPQFKYNVGESQIDFDTLRAAMTRVEQQLAGGASDAEMPQLLLRLGTMKLVHEPHADDVEGLAYVKERPAEFFYNEFHDFYGYNGYHFRQLIERFPQSGLADDAAYLLTKLKAEGQECEGWVPCYLHREWQPARAFLTAYPTSPLADSAFSSVANAFNDLVDPVTPDKDYTTDDKEVSQIIAAVDSVAPGLPEPLRSRVTDAVGRWRGWLAQTR